MHTAHRLALVAALIVVASCGGNGDAANGGGTEGGTTLTESSGGGSIRLAVGETFDVALEGNPTTGFGWLVDAVDNEVVMQRGDFVFTPASDLIGAGGVLTLTFEAMGAGETELELIYARPFEIENVEGRFAVTVIVE
jgi:inhibitor of cysteine peptidase